MDRNERLENRAYTDHAVKLRSQHVRLYLKPESSTQHVAMDEIQFYGEKYVASSSGEQLKWINITGGEIDSSAALVGTEYAYEVKRSTNRIRLTVTGSHVYDSTDGKCKGDCVLHTKTSIWITIRLFRCARLTASKCKIVVLKNSSL